MATRMQQRRATAAQWTSANPVLAAGEIGFETDTNKFKIGNSVNTWDTLEYFTAGAEVDLSGYATETYVDSENASQTATITAAYEAYADGATTDMATTTYVDAQDATTLAAANSYTDTEIAALVDSSPATLDTLNELAAALGDDANFATTVSNQIAGKADASHTHAISDVTNLQTELDGKLSSRVLLGEETIQGDTEFRFSSISQDYDELIFEGVDLSLEAWDQFRLRINSINAEVNFPTTLTDIFTGNTSSSTSNVFELRIPNYSLTDRPKMGTYSFAGYNPAMGYASGQGVIFDNTFNAITQVRLETGDEDFSKGTIRMYGIKY